MNSVENLLIKIDEKFKKYIESIDPEIRTLNDAIENMPSWRSRDNLVTFGPDEPYEKAIDPTWKAIRMIAYFAMIGVGFFTIAKTTDAMAVLKTIGFISAAGGSIGAIHGGITYKQASKTVEGVSIPNPFKGKFKKLKGRKNELERGRNLASLSRSKMATFLSRPRNAITDRLLLGTMNQKLENDFLVDVEYLILNSNFSMLQILASHRMVPTNNRFNTVTAQLCSLYSKLNSSPDSKKGSVLNEINNIRQQCQKYINDRDEDKVTNSQIITPTPLEPKKEQINPAPTLSSQPINHNGDNRYDTLLYNQGVPGGAPKLERKPAQNETYGGSSFGYPGSSIRISDDDEIKRRR